MSRWDSVDTDRYDEQWRKLEAAGNNVHGEVDFVMDFAPKSVLDAGCGTGRVAIELARRGVEVVGVDLDGPMIEKAKAKAPELDFIVGDLASYAAADPVDLAVMAGNVIIFVDPGTEADVIANLGAAVVDGGHLVSGFQLNRGISVDEFTTHARASGLELVEHWSTWDRAPASDGDDYAVLVYRKAVA